LTENNHVLELDVPPETEVPSNDRGFIQIRRARIFSKSDRRVEPR
jgi:hypothetical protein